MIDVIVGKRMKHIPLGLIVTERYYRSILRFVLKEIIECVRGYMCTALGMIRLERQCHIWKKTQLINE